MTDVLSSPSATMPRGSAYHRNCLDEYRPPASRFGGGGGDLRHSRSDELVLQGGSGCGEGREKGHNGVSAGASKGSASALNESPPFRDDLLLPVVPVLLSRSQCFAEADDEARPSQVLEAPPRIRPKGPHHVGIYDRVDPEDSIRDMITENDFYRFVLFKKHYEKYLHLSQKYEEARNIAYYLEEKYHEVKAERDGLAVAKEELQRRLGTREAELHDKEEELFLQLERVVRLEEDCEKLRAEKEKFAEWKDALEKEKMMAYKRLKEQSAESEATRRHLERARQDVVRQVSVIVAERDVLERENETLKQQLNDERRGVGYFLCDLTEHKKLISQNMDGLEKEVTELKKVARQSATLNSQLKKGMQHLATCKRKKCHVCSYTRDAFGEYAGQDSKKLFSCLQAPLQDWRGSRRRQAVSASPSPYCSDEGELDDEDNSTETRRTRSLRRRSTGASASGCPNGSPLPSCRSEYSFRRAYASTAPSSPSPTPSLPLPLPLHCLGPHISYIDDASTSSADSGQGEERCSGTCTCLVPTDDSLTSGCSAPSTARAFSSDSGFSSELYDSGARCKQRAPSSSPSTSGEAGRSRTSTGTASSPPNFQRGTRWTTSLRKLLGKVANKKTTGGTGTNANYSTPEQEA